jgi:RNA polymerase sigma-70 factor (ECF subfamily)
MDLESRREADLQDTGPVEARYLAFLETITTLRPNLHRYCSRMTGSVLDGEDVVQEALFQAYRTLDSYDDSRPLAPWLFRIAHNRCIDFLRRRGVRENAEAAVEEPDPVMPVEPAGPDLGRAVEHLVLRLPPKERACVLLKDVFDYSLEEIAERVDSTVGSVKSALHRGRARLPATAERKAPRPAKDDEARLLHLYVERFNRQDWDGLRELIADDARLRVADRYAGRFADAPYFYRYQQWPVPWRLVVGEVDGEPVIINLQRGADGSEVRTVIRFEVSGQRVTRIADYIHCPWVLRAAASAVVDSSWSH